ncbi:DMT family transporter [Natrialba taiwanensis]|uniref:SPW repeat-containing protein n=1 Tax=Natrialba taiwanensis DSM 12281 TaxID=1230458 RepID=L9ZZ87_9EURY|nr:DMT family transporter [Natrialba taiwanensis]ELY90897.1 hypothetical protein C484_11756 [Natrialba taiwanensis DSM 12281]
MTRPTWDASEHEQTAKHDERGRDADAVAARDVIEHEPNSERRGTWLSASIVLLGAIVIGQAIAVDSATGQRWNAFLTGAALIVAGGYNYARRADRDLGSTGVAALSTIVGVWLVVSPLVMGPNSGRSAATEFSMAAMIGSGLLVVVIGSYSAVVIRKRRRNAGMRRTAVYDRRGQ